MEKVRKFDEELRKVCADAFLGNRILTCIFGGIGSIFMLLPWDMLLYEGDNIDGIILWMEFCFPASAVLFYLTAYQRITEGGKTVSIYQKLEYMPVTKAEIRKVRCEYLRRFCLRYGAICFFMQQAVALLHHSFGLVSILYVFVWAGIWYLSGWIYLFF